MKKLKDYEKDLKTCSKCGLCQSVCPVYKMTGIETVVSRGKFNLLLGLIKGKLKYTKNLNKALSLCLNCKACDDFCPSSIKATDIINTAKQENNTIIFPIIRYNFFKLTMFAFLFIFNFYRLTHFSKLVPKINKLIKKFGTLGNFFLIFDKISKINVKRKKTTGQNSSIKVIYFEGCYTKYINPSIKNATLNLLEKKGIKVLQKNFECCGLSALYKGNFALYQKLKNYNKKLLNQECDYIVCDCATCYSALKEYNEEFSSKVIDISELLSSIDIKNKSTITYHLPCHLRDKKEKINKYLFNSFKNYKKMKDFDVCCGFAGDFCISFPKISAQISKEKALNIQKTNSQYVLTSCPGCIIGLEKGLIESNIDKKVLSIPEYVELNS